MIERVLKFLETYLTGGYSIKLKENLYLGFPRLAPVFTVAFIVTAIGEFNEIPLVMYTGYALIVLGIFGFFFYDIFPSRRPEKPKED